MTQKEIKEQCEACYYDIECAKSLLESLREQCKHPDTFEGYYSLREGQAFPAIICNDCGKCVRFINP